MEFKNWLGERNIFIITIMEMTICRQKFNEQFRKWQNSF